MRMLIYYFWLCIASAVLYGITEPGVLASTCPAVCFCPSVSRIVYCPRKGLPFIPSGIPPDTVQLNLNENMFSNPVISRANFSRYKDIEQLYLTGCGIEFIEVDTFVDNKKLKWLDIGKNKLKTISDFTFRDLTLDHLFLNDNPGVSISTRAFSGLRTTGLYMQNNGLDKLSLEIIRPMNGTLKTLWLDGNKFERFNSQWLFLFKTLSHLRIGDNPLHCNCEANWLYDFYINTSRIFEGASPPGCRSPGNLRGKLFTEVQEDELKCQLPIFKNVDVIFEQNHGKVTGKMTCLANGDPIPTIYWTKPDGETEVFIPKSEEKSKDMEGVMYVRNPETNAKNRYQCVASNPAGNVTFSINVAWPTVSEYEPEIDQSKKPLNDIPLYDKDEITSDKIEKKEDVKVEAEPGSVNASSSKVTAQHLEAVTTSNASVKFTIDDIVGAVVGTFLLTLLLCIIVFHLFYRHKRKSGCHQGHCNGVRPPSRHELDKVEHTMKMLENKTYQDFEKHIIDIHV